MTDLEKVELAVRRTATECGGSAIGYWLHKLADQLAQISKEDREADRHV